MTQNNLIWPITAESDIMMNQSKLKAKQAVRVRPGKRGKTLCSLLSLILALLLIS